MKKVFSSIILFALLTTMFTGCAPAQQPIQLTHTSLPVRTTSTPSALPSTVPSPLPPTFTPSPIPPTFTPEPTLTATPTPTSEPQQILLRRKCGHDYVVKPDEPLQIYYGGWGVHGKDLSVQWSTALTATLTIDGVDIYGELQPATYALPYNCTTQAEDVYWLYFMVIIPGLSAGQHEAAVTIASLRALDDGSGTIFGPGDILTQTFTITTR